MSAGFMRDVQPTVVSVFPRCDLTLSLVRNCLDVIVLTQTLLRSTARQIARLVRVRLNQGRAVRHIAFTCP